MSQGISCPAAYMSDNNDSTLTRRMPNLVHKSPMASPCVTKPSSKDCAIKRKGVGWVVVIGVGGGHKVCVIT